MKKIVKLVILCFLVLNFMIVISCSAKANIYFPYEKNITLSDLDSEVGEICEVGYYNYELNSKLVKVVSSNKKVADVYKVKKNVFKFEVMGYGKTVFTITVKEGKAYKKYKSTFRYVKYTNPFSKVLLGNKNIRKAFNSHSDGNGYCVFSYTKRLSENKKPGKEKLRFILKPGWKIVSLKKDFQEFKNNDYVVYGNGGSSYNGSTQISKVWYSGGSYRIEIKNEKTGQEEYMNLHIEAEYETQINVD